MTETKRDQGRRDKWPTVSFRVHPDERHTLTLAAATLGLNRSEFMIQILLREARRILGASG